MIMTTKLLTAYNKDVQRFMMKNGRCTTKRKTAIITAIEEAVINAGGSFGKLFPSKSKRKDVMDEIMFLLSGSGICKVESKTLANKLNCSVRTVFDAVKNIKATGEVLVAGLADGKNKYVFVLKSHTNFETIMKEVFFLETTGQNDGQIAELQDAENVETTGIDEKKTTINGFDLNISKQERDIIQRFIENDVQESESNTAEMREKLVNYTANENQLMFFDLIMDFPFPQAIKDKAGILALRMGMDCDEKRRAKAWCLLNNIASNMVNGVEIRNVVAVFSEGIDKPLDRYIVKKAEMVAPPKPKLKIPVFYNWLEERE